MLFSPFLDSAKEKGAPQKARHVRSNYFTIGPFLFDGEGAVARDAHFDFKQGIVGGHGSVAAAADELMVLLTVGKEGLCIFLAVGRMIAFKAIKRLFPYCLQSPSKPRAMKVACRMGQKGHPASFVKGRHGLFDRGKNRKIKAPLLNEDAAEKVLYIPA